MGHQIDEVNPHDPPESQALEQRHLSAVRERLGLTDLDHRQLAQLHAARRLTDDATLTAWNDNNSRERCSLFQAELGRDPARPASPQAVLAAWSTAAVDVARSGSSRQAYSIE